MTSLARTTQNKSFTQAKDVTNRPLPPYITVTRIKHATESEMRLFTFKRSIFEHDWSCLQYTIAHLCDNNGVHTLHQRFVTQNSYPYIVIVMT